MTKQWFTCERCGGHFWPRNTDEESVEGMLAVMPEAAGAAPEDIATLCDECYQDFLTWFATQSSADKAAMRGDYNRKKGIQ